MNGIFGPDTRLKRNEREIANAVVSGNQMLRPLIGDNYVKFDYVPKASSDGNGYMPESDALQFIKGGVIIPFDLVDVPEETFNGWGKKRSGFFKCQKYIGRPDFFLAKEEDGVVNLYPVDIKTGSNGKKENREIKQISMYNSMHLIYNNVYAKEMVIELKKHFKKHIVLQNGFFIGDGVWGGKKNNVIIERYLERNLRNEVNFWYKNIDNLGLRFSHGKDAELLMDAEKIFESDMECMGTVREEVNLWNYLNFIKNRVADNGVFPCRVNVIQGFNGYRMPLKRLEYEPMSHIRTLDPDIGKLEDEIAQIGFMAPEEIMGMYHKIIKVSREGHLEKLKKDLEREIEKDVEETGRKWEKKCVWSADDVRGKDTDDELNCLFKHKEKEINNFAIKSNRRRTTIAKLEDAIAKLTPKILEARERNHENNLRRYTPEWFKEAEERRKKLIEEKEKKKRFLGRQLEERVNGYAEDIVRLREETRREEWESSGRDSLKYHFSPEQKTRFLSSMRTTDRALNSRMFDFRIFNYKNKLVKLAESPVFPTPEENYLYLSKSEMCQVLMFNALELVPNEVEVKTSQEVEDKPIEIEIPGHGKINI